jgi:hypothetical protein
VLVSMHKFHRLGIINRAFNVVLTLTLIGAERILRASREALIGWLDYMKYMEG